MYAIRSYYDPITDSSLVRLMEAQAFGRCGVVPAHVVDQGIGAVRAALDALRAAGRRYARITSYNVCYTKLLRSGTISLTRPKRKAVSASIISPVSSICCACLGATARVSATIGVEQ